MLKFTTARYDLANGRTIDKRLSEDKSLWGVDPNEGLVILESPEEFRDRIESREPYIVITDDEPEEGACGNVEWIKNTFNDHQLSQALLAIQTKLETDQWPILTDTDPVIEGIREEVTELAKERIEILKTLIDVDKQLTSLQTELDEEDASIFPEDVNLKNVRMTITDADGIALGTWRVKNGDVEAALDSLQLEPELQTDE